jgi:hypothetical protein
MIERYFLACETADENAAQFGPFKTAAEAEAQTRKLGWTWVLVFSHILNEAGTVVDVKTRFYEVAPDRETRSPGDVEAIRRMVIPGHLSHVTPLNASETKFFKQYEKQMAGQDEEPEVYEIEDQSNDPEIRRILGLDK